MKFLNEIMKSEAYSLNDNKISFQRYINQLTVYHYKRSNLYKKFLNSLKYKPNNDYQIHELPFLPVRSFKQFDLLSVNKRDIYKTLHSSGTTSNLLSKIYLDKANALNQINVLKKIFFKTVVENKLPMIIIDKKNNFDQNSYNATIAAIRGFSIFANDIVYLLDQNNNINYQELNKFLSKNKNRFIIFGLTSNIYLNLIEKIDKNKIDKKKFENSILIHGGGWKKILDKKLNHNDFNSLLSKNFGIQRVINYYGLVEQIGSIFFECKCGYFIPSNFSDIIIRDENLKVCETGEKGMVQLLSLLPTSYPGHSILTEDIGEIINDEKCRCYGDGKRFIIHGRLKSAEIRGCSNV